MSSFFFFFSSRRRHTRCSRDWSSDVCSSDLVLEICAHVGAYGAVDMITPVLTLCPEVVEEDGVFRHPYLVPCNVALVGEQDWLPIPAFALCHTPLPAYFCTCGRYALFALESEASWA